MSYPGPWPPMLPTGWPMSPAPSPHAEMEIRERLVRVEATLPHVTERVQAHSGRLALGDTRMVEIETRILKLEPLPSHIEKLEQRVDSLEERRGREGMSRKELLQWIAAALIFAGWLSGKIGGPEATALLRGLMGLAPG